MAKESAVSIGILEKQYATLEKKIIREKSKKIVQLEKSIGKQKNTLEKTKKQLATVQSRLKLAKTPAKKQSIKAQKSTISGKIDDAKAELKGLKSKLSDAKIDYKNALLLQKAKNQAIKEAANPKRKKKVLGKKIKAKKVDKNTAVPKNFLGVDTSKPVAKASEEKQVITESKPESIAPVEPTIATPIEEETTSFAATTETSTTEAPSTETPTTDVPVPSPTDAKPGL